ncbi:Elongation_factor Tu GTP binding and transmembrane domain-containing protein [Hexamita inflata]|uniref:Elongation factor Tu GTP binding and transmembrane domain-containing protein n=1 Tax=Hexamita inflata TaxID=28002 RepID=A0AA86PYN5_9EUKA|nr:Elongation factor Tu GTP binding and transmembrane domain-containing protein [Hexamita inflata]
MTDTSATTADLTAMSYIQCAISSLYQDFLVPASTITSTPLPFVPNRKFSVLVLGASSLGKSSFINHFIKTPILKTGKSQTTEQLTFILPGQLRQSLNYANGKHLFPELAQTFDKYCPEYCDQALVEIFSSMNQQLEFSAMFKSMTETFGADIDSPPSPFLFIDSPGLTSETPKSVIKCLEVLALQVDAVMLFVDQYSPPHTFNYIQYIQQAKLESKLYIVKPKLDELDSANDIIQSLSELSQLIARQTTNTFKLYTIALPQFALSQKQKMNEDFRKQMKLQELQNPVQKSAMQSTYIDNSMLTEDIRNYNKEITEPPVCLGYYLNQIDAVESRIYTMMNDAFQKAISSFNNDTQEIYEKLTQLKAEQNQIQSENRKKRVLGAGIFAIAVYIVLMLMLQIIGLKNNQTVNKIFMVNIAQMKDKMFRLALLAAVGFLVLIGYFVESSVKHIDSAEVNNMIKQFDEQLMDKIGVWA